MLEDTAADDVAIEISDLPNIEHDPIYKLATSYCHNNASYRFAFVREVIVVLYRVGAIGVKLTPSDKFIYSHIDEPLINQQHISDRTKIRIHAMLHAAFRIESN